MGVEAAVEIADPGIPCAPRRDRAPGKDGIGSGTGKKRDNAQTRSLHHA